MVRVEDYYDDWFLYWIDQGEGNTYGLIKMREAEDPDGFDGDDPGCTVSFVEFDINVLNETIKGKTTMHEFDAHCNNVVYEDGAKYSPILQGYFSNEYSKGGYIIADSFVEKITPEMWNNGIVPFPKGFNEMMPNERNRVINNLKEINELSDKKVYDEENKCLIINNPKSLTEFEKYAVLTLFSSDKNMNQFVTEVKFHSDALVNLGIVPTVYESAIRADMAIGEYRPEGIRDWLKNIVEPKPYYNDHSRSVLEMQDIHGKW